MNRRTFFATVLAPLVAKPLTHIPAGKTFNVTTVTCPPLTFADIEAAYLTAWKGTTEPDYWVGPAPLFQQMIDRGYVDA